MANKHRYELGDMVAFRAGQAHLIGELCIRDYNLYGDGIDAYDIMIAADLYRCGRYGSGLFHKHVPETSIERKVGRAVPLREGDFVRCAWWEEGTLEERYGRIETLGPGYADLKLRDGSSMRARLPEQGLSRLRTVWEEDGGAINGLVRYTGYLTWDEHVGCWAAEDSQGGSMEDVWPGSGALTAGDDFLAKVDGEWYAVELARSADGQWKLAGAGVESALEGLPVIGPYLSSRTGEGGLELWRCAYTN